MIGSAVEYVLQSVAHTSSLPLTDRQVEILTLLALGLSEKEVAFRLGISLRTARNHVANLYQRPGLHHRTEAVLVAVRNGLAKVEPVARGGYELAGTSRRVTSLPRSR
jgi:DNA-binding NarL/FixJ family response regulator